MAATIASLKASQALRIGAHQRDKVCTCRMAGQRDPVSVEAQPLEQFHDLLDGAAHAGAA